MKFKKSVTTYLMDNGMNFTFQVNQLSEAYEHFLIAFKR